MSTSATFPSSQTVLRGGRVFKRGKHILTSAPLTDTLLTMGAVSLLSFAATPAHANCAPAATGGADTVSCNTPGTVIDNYDALGGDDNITISNPAGDPPLTQVAGTVSGGLGNDTFTFTSGLVHRIRGNGGDDILNMSGGATNQEINLDGGNNTATFTGGTVGAHVFSGTGTDTITIDGSALITGVVGTGAGSDLITINGGSVGSIDGGDGVDTILLNAGTVTGRVDWGAGDESQVLDLSGMAPVGHLRFGHGADVFELTDGQVNGFVELGRQGNDDLGGSNTFTLSGGTILGSIIAGDQGDTIVLNSGTVGGVLGGDGRTDRGTTGADTITLDGATVNLDINSGGGADQINIVSGSVRNVLADEGADTITVSGGTVTGRVRGQDGDDTIILSGGTVGGTVEGESGNDTITILDGFTVGGTGIDGGADDDTLVIDTVAGRSFAGATNFENLRKDGTGILTLTGGQTYSTSTTITGGTLDVDGTLRSPSITMTTGGTTLNVDGLIEGLTLGSVTTIAGSGGDDTLLVNGAALLRATGDLGDGTDDLMLAGTINTGSGSLSFGGGDDGLGLSDGAVITGLLDGGAEVVEDRIVVNVAGTLSLDGSNVTGWEYLQKLNTGALTLSGNHQYANGIFFSAGTINVTDTLAVAGIMMGDDTQLNISGVVDNGAGAQAALFGSTGANMVNITSGGILFATGDLGDGADILDVSGVLNAGVGGTLTLGTGDDRFIMRDGADVTGTVDGGAGAMDLFNAIVSSSAMIRIDQVTNFETLDKDGAGTLSLDGPGMSTIDTVNLNAGILTIDAGATLGSTMANLADDTTLNVNGTLDDGAGGQVQLAGSTGTNIVNVNGDLSAFGDMGDGADILDVSGTLNTGAGALTLGSGNDTFTIHDGTAVVGTVDGGTGADVINTDISTTASLGITTGFETLTKTGVGILNITGPGASSFDTVNINAGTLDIAAVASLTNVSAATLSAGATLNLNGAMGFTPGDDTFSIAGILTGASNIDMLGGDDSLTIQGTADLSGYSGILDGGAGGADSILFDGWSGSVDGTDYQNWEAITVQSGTVDFGPTLTVGSGPGLGLIAGSGGIIDSTAPFDLTGDLVTLGGGTFRNQTAGATLVNIIGNIRNSGTVNVQDGATGDTIVASGDYSGAGSLLLDVDFTGNTADTLTIGGDVVTGGTTIFVADISTGAASGTDILLVDVAGTTVDGDFQLAGGTISVDALDYVLNRVGTQWLLQLSVLPQNVLYEAYPRNLMALNEMLTHRQRVQDRTWLAGGDTQEQAAGVWVRFDGGIRDLDPTFSTTAVDLGSPSIDYDISTYKIEAGVEMLLSEYSTGRLVGGARAFYGNSNLSGSAPTISGDIDTDAIGVGASLTWYDNSSFYVDAQLQYASFDSDISASTSANSLISGNDGFGYAASLEVGKTFALNNGFSVTPELQYVYSEVDFDSFTASTGETVSLDDGSTSELRIGTTFEYTSANATSVSAGFDDRFFVTANAYHQFDTTTQVTSAGNALVNEVRPWRGELGIGGSREWVGSNGQRSAIFGEVTVGSDLGSSFSSGSSIGGRLGFKMEF